MQFPYNEPSEQERLQALYDTALLFTQDEARFDRLTRLAQQLFQVDIALISLVAKDLQWFKSRQGLEVAQTERDISFCSHAILQDDVFVVPDATRDGRFVDNPLVTGEPHIRLYAGAPLRIGGGHKIGTLCIIHSQPGDFPAEKRQLLRDLADLVELEIRQVDTQKQLARAELAERRLASVIEGTHIGTWEWNVQTGETQFNERWAQMLGYTLAELAPISIDTWLSLAHPDDLANSNLALEAHFSGNAEFYDVQCRMRHRDGHWIWVHDRGRLVNRTPDGLPLLMAGTHADVTEQVAAKQALEVSERQYRTLVDNIPGITYRCASDDQGTLLYLSHQIEALTGHPASWFVDHQRSYQSIVHPEDQAGLALQRLAALENRQTWALEYRLLHRDGSVRWAQERGSPVFDEAGDLLYLDGFILDITSEKELRRETQRHLQAFAVLNEIASNPSLDVLEQTQKALRLGAEFLGLECAVMSRVRGDRYRVDDFVGAAQSMARGAEFPLEQTLCVNAIARRDLLALTRVSASEFSGQPQAQPLQCDTYIGIPLEVTGACYGTLAFFSEAARPAPFTDSELLFMRLLGRWAATSMERHLSVEALQQSETRLRGLFELSPYGIALNDLDTGKFIAINQALVAPTGYTEAEFASLSYWQLTPEDYAEQEEQQLKNLRETGRYGPYEKEYMRKDGTRYPVLLNGMLVPEPGGRKVIWSIIEDISERKLMQRMKDQFVSTVSHELRTPLTAIRGALALVESGSIGELPELAAKMVAVAERNSQRLLLLINDLLDMEKLVAGKMRFDLVAQPLAPLIQQALEENRTYADQFNVRLRWENLAGLCCTRVDAARLQQVMANLLSNAIKFSPADGEVLVTVTRDGGWIRIGVADNGPGIPPEFRERIFQKFSQADGSDSRQKGGTGLGLAITRELVEKMDGTVSFHTEVGQGTQFFVELPEAAGKTPD